MFFIAYVFYSLRLFKLSIQCKQKTSRKSYKIEFLLNCTFVQHSYDELDS